MSITMSITLGTSSPKNDRRKSSPNNSNIVLGITNDLLYPSLRIKMNFFLLILKMINIY